MYECVLLSRTKIHVKQVLIDYSINMNFIIMVLIIMINNFKWGCLAIGIFQIYQLDNTFLCLLHTNKLPDICTARSRLRKSPRRVLQTNKHICSNKLPFVLKDTLKKFKMQFIPILNWWAFRKFGLRRCRILWEVWQKPLVMYSYVPTWTLMLTFRIIS